MKHVTYTVTYTVSLRRVSSRLFSLTPLYVSATGLPSSLHSVQPI